MATKFLDAGGDSTFAIANGFLPTVTGTVKIKKNVRELLWGGKWEKQVRPLLWLIEKFMPVNGWTQEDINKLKGGGN